jgi:tRNA (guanine-N7-)-methyltransferase
MARVRRATQVWGKPAAQAAAARVLVPDDEPALSIEPMRLFGRDAPLEVEIGAGKGEFMIERAAAIPERNFLAIELSASLARLLAVRAGRSELANLRVLRADARTVVNLLLPDQSVAAYHIYFPDPWPKERQMKHRLFTPHFASGLRRTLSPDGRVHVASDVRDYAESIFASLEAAGLSRSHEPVPARERSGFWRKYCREAKQIFAATFDFAHSDGERSVKQE